MDHSLEKQLLSTFIQDREAYAQVEALVQGTDFSDVGRIILSQVAAYYQKDQEAGSCDVPTLKARIQRKYKKQAEALHTYIDMLPATVSTSNILEELLDQRKIITESRLGNLLLDPSHSDNDVAAGVEQWLQIEDMKQRLHAPEVSLDDEILGPSPEQIIEVQGQYEFLPVLPGKLNQMVQGVARGEHVVVFARPETGKTGFCVNMAAGWIKRGMKVCHIGNEETIMSILTRYIARLTQSSFTMSDLQDAPLVTRLLGELKEPLSRLMVKRMNPGSEREIRKVIEEFQPDVVMVDQILNLNEKSMEGLARSSGMMRRLGGEYGVIMVSVTQADEASEGRTHLKLHNIFMSKTAVQGDADLLIGLGASADYVQADLLHINVLKAKGRPPGSHGDFAVRVNRTCGKLETIK